jgi:TolB-like protein
MLKKVFVLCVAMALMAATRAWADPATTRPTVAVAPFQVLGPDGHDWLGRAVQEGLATSLQKSSGFSGVIIAGLAPADARAAIDMTKSATPDVVIFGAVQIQDDQIRVTGQLISIHTGRPLGALIADGAQRDLFSIEDRVADRCRAILAASSVAKPPRASGPPPTLELVGPTITSTTSRYFDGNVMSQITPPARFQDEYDRYYNQSGNTSGFGCVFSAPGYSWCWGGAGGYGIGGGAPRMVYPVAAPISGW